MSYPQTGRIIGTCSLCDGPVWLPPMMVDPTPTCKRCGAVAKDPHGPVIPMTRPVKAVGRTAQAHKTSDAFVQTLGDTDQE